MHLSKWLAVIHSLIQISLAVLVNVTIDDSYGEDITYLPPHQWSADPKSVLCSAEKELNRTRIFHGTWHNGTANKPGAEIAPVIATVPFFGSAVYVYCVIANIETFSQHTMDITFLIDTQLAGNYSRTLVNDGTFEYNVLVYANQSLPHDEHVLTIQNGRVGGATSTVLLDYIIYSYESDLIATAAPIQPASAGPAAHASDLSAGNRSSTVNPAGKIVGSVLGSLGGTLLVLVAFLWHRQSTWKGSSNDRHLAALSPEYTSRNPFARMRGWWRSSRQRSRFSFNPSLLFEPTIVNQERATAPTFRRPPPITTVHPIYPRLQRPDLTHQLYRTNREVIPIQSLDPRNEPNQPLSIMEWQRRTQREADDVPPRLDVSDVDMSSYYEFSSDTPDPPPPRRPPLKRFTVVNN